ncbi:uncharacterized protein MELLADRAFT_103653 [Melampsora larici-populina 98AG31]|uniref:Uncharacterized protein n=1 Tax=Melampsora larici-populina (strain 98AG31 / pathotype 3-4-7) TaxID=747676 RepID=F4RC13_MELLP|nr:uncharacterized protein MELLADRAFT_103653 [Melampsora larici-populina 98AG31]EGG10199.1 hypothetical protein MELLADRAFT_103653 [Melampsora larici-populina 98AG31]
MAVIKAELATKSVEYNNEASILLEFKGELPYKLGPANMSCQHCGALQWPQEQTNYEADGNSSIFSNCCKQGDVTIALTFFEGCTPPEELMDLYVGNDPRTPICLFMNGLTITDVHYRFKGLLKGHVGLQQLSLFCISWVSC